MLQRILDSPGEHLNRRARRKLRSQDDRGEWLAEIPLLADAPKKYLRTIDRLADEVTFSKGSVLFEEGDPGVAMFLVLL